MGHSISFFIGGNPLDWKHRKCDGKSLADYYLAVMADGLGIDELFGDLFGGHPRQAAQDKIIRHDFRKNQPRPEAKAEDQGLLGNLRLFTAYISNADEGRETEIDLAALEILISRIRAGIADYRGSLINIVGDDVTCHRDGAIEDCDDILMAIALCRKGRRPLRISLG